LIIFHVYIITKMKTQIKLRLKEFKIEDFSNGLIARRIGLTDSRVKDLYNTIKTLVNKYYWIDRPDDQSLTYRILYGLLDGNSLVELIDNSGDANATKKKSFEAVWYLSQSMGYIEEKVNVYHEKFKEYNRKTKEGGRTIPDIMSDELFASYRLAMNLAIQELTVALTNESPISLVIKYQKTLLRILLIEFPTRNAPDYYLLRNDDDGQNSYYNKDGIHYRSSNGTYTVVRIPEEYLSLFESYHQVAKNLSDFFFFGERNKGQIDSNNFSGYVSKLFGMNLQGFKNKWGEIIKSKKGTSEYAYYNSISGKNS